jgi:chitinase
MLLLGATNFNKLRLREMTPYLDFYNLMAYDYAGNVIAAAGNLGILSA